MSILINACSCRSLHAECHHASVRHSALRHKRRDCMFQPRGATKGWWCRQSATAAAQEAESIAPPGLPPVSNEQQLDEEERWLASSIQVWQDDEWQVQDNHHDLGVAVGKAYRAVRSAGENDIGSILLSIASDLEAFNFDETFTGNFEVANKAVELLMSNDGQEVCECG